MNMVKQAIIFYGLCVSAQMFSMSLPDICCKKIWDNPRNYINQNLKSLDELSGNSIRNSFAERPIKKGLWYRRMLATAMQSPVLIPARDIWFVRCNNNVVLIKALTSTEKVTRSLPYVLPDQVTRGTEQVTFLVPNFRYYSFEGQEVQVEPAEQRDTIHITTSVEYRVERGNDITYIPEVEKVFAEWGKRRSWRISSVKHASYVEQNGKLVILTSSDRVEIYDLNACNEFHEYLSERAPLSQLLVIRMIEQACESNKKISLSPQEYKILEAFPPKYSAAIAFMKKFI